MKTKELLHNVFSKIGKIPKSQRNFLISIITCLYSMRGRANFTNISRYMSYNECTIRRNFSKSFVFVEFNKILVQESVPDELVAVIDATFILKNGDKTDNKGKFWSSCDSKVKNGLEVSVVAVTDIFNKITYTIDATQTPAGLKTSEDASYSRIDFYIEQLQDIDTHLNDLSIKYIVGDGYYAKIKMFTYILSAKKHFVTHLRSDANLKYFAKPKQRNGDRGNFRKYDEKLNFKKLADELKKFEYHGQMSDKPQIEIYSKVMYGIQFKLALKIVIMVDTRTKKYVVLCSTDTTQDAMKVIQFYSLRFQIEFIFRDAKQFTGLTHCQSRKDVRLDFHFNLSLTALNVARFEMRLYNTANSLNDYVRKHYNLYIINELLANLDLPADFDINKYPNIKNIVNIGIMAA